MGEGATNKIKVIFGALVKIYIAEDNLYQKRSVLKYSVVYVHVVSYSY